MIRVLYVIGQLGVGGTESQLLCLLRHMDRTVFQPYVVCLSEKAPLKTALQSLGCEVTTHPTGLVRRLRVICRLVADVRRFRPDIVHSFGFAGRAVLPLQSLGFEFQHVNAIRSLPPYWTNQPSKWTDKLVMATSSCVVANSERALESLIDGIGVNREKCLAIHNGLDLDEFDRSMTQEVRLSRFPTRVDLREPVVCAVANLRPVKRLDVLVRAFSRVAKEFLDVSLWLVGDGPSRAMLAELARDLGISSRVHFLGHRREIPAILNLASLGVLCSDREGLSNAIIEYMAAGLPVVATDVGGNGELVRHGETGLLVPAGEPKALAEAILYLLDRPEVARQFAEAGRLRVEEHFTAQRMVGETERLYRELVGRHGT